MIFCLVSLLIAAAQAILIRGPFGERPVTYKVVTLTDHSRWDPYAAEDKPHKRRILISVFTPLRADITACQPERIPYMPPATLDTYLTVVESLGLPRLLLQDNELDFCKLTQGKSEEIFPVIIFSPGFSASRLFSSAQAQSLASHGYIVITMDHPYEATAVEFPNGEVVYGFNITDVSIEVIEKAVRVRTEDVSFLIDQLPHICALSGSHRFVEEVFVYGQSLGGATAALAVSKDDRVIGGLNFDGTISGPVAEEGLNKPFVLVGPPIMNDTRPPFNGFLDKLRGPKMLLLVEGTEHQSFMDAPLLVASQVNIPPEYIPAIEVAFGTIDGRKFAHVMDDILRSTASFLFECATGLCGIDVKFEEVTVYEDKFCT